jgi:hypothetical protein
MAVRGIDPPAPVNIWERGDSDRLSRRLNRGGAPSDVVAGALM